MTTSESTLRILGCLVLSSCLLLVPMAPGAAEGSSLRFFGNGRDGIDRVKIRIADPGPPADVGDGDFTLEFWMKAAASENTAPAVSCGQDVSWRHGNAVIDRDRFNQGRSFGVSIAGGRVAFGVSGDGTGDRTLCGLSNVLDYEWHHVTVQRRRVDGRLWLHVDGVLEAEADGPDGDLSYPDDGVPGNFCGGPCTESDPFLVLGAAKHDAGPAFPSYGGWLDEVRLSRVLRYAGHFTRPAAPFVPDADTAALYHLDEGGGDAVVDSSGAPGGPSDGARHLGGAPGGPAWSTDTAPLEAPLVAVELVAGGLDRPVDVRHAGDGSGRLFIVLQDGRILIHDGARLLDEPFLDLRSRVACCVGEQGMASIAFHPDYASNGYFFVTYADAETGAGTVARYSVSAADPSRADPDSGTVLLVTPQRFPIHYAGNLHFGPDGYLYVSRGDGGSFLDSDGFGQNLGTLLGKMIRIDVDTASPYAVPADNPFAGEAGAEPEIWALGLRNPWRFSFDRVTGDAFITDVGQSLWEEVNFQPAHSGGGENYGWSVMEGNHCFNPEVGCDATGLTLPVIEYPHTVGCSVTGGFRYRGRRIPEILGQYLFSDWCVGRIWGASQDGGGNWSAIELLDTPHQPVGFGEDEAGELHFAHRPFSGPGGVYRLVHAAPHAQPALTGVAPASAMARDPGFDLFLGGSGFARSSIVRWNGQDRPTLFVSDTLLVASVPDLDIAAAATAELSVFTPGPGGGLSGGTAFSILERFTDVVDHWARPFIDALGRAGLTAGCAPAEFCPETPVTRAQSAILVLRGMEGAGFTPAAATGLAFSDVPATAFAAAWIEALAALGITGGCALNPSRYCPDENLTRGQVAVLLLRARHGSAYRPPAAAGTLFEDVPGDHPLAAWVEQLALEGITSGCAPGRFCPDSPVSRGQMAVFLVRAFGLP
jgi:glucose/arabinose dehydrogenase